MPMRLDSRVLRPIVSTSLAAWLIAGTAAMSLAQGPGAAGTVKGFVRVNGKARRRRITSYAVTAPDSFDPSVEVTAGPA